MFCFRFGHFNILKSASYYPFNIFSKEKTLNEVIYKNKTYFTNRACIGF